VIFLAAALRIGLAEQAACSRNWKWTSGATCSLTKFTNYCPKGRSRAAVRRFPTDSFELGRRATWNL